MEIPEDPRLPNSSRSPRVELGPPSRPVVLADKEMDEVDETVEGSKRKPRSRSERVERVELGSSGERAGRVIVPAAKASAGQEFRPRSRKSSLNTGPPDNARASQGRRQSRELSLHRERQILEYLAAAPNTAQEPNPRVVQVHPEQLPPPLFEQQLLSDLQLGVPMEVLNWYATELLRRDPRGIPGMMGQPSLVEEIMERDAISRLWGREGPGWRPVRQLGIGAQGGVVLWEKVREDGPVGFSFPRQIVEGYMC